MKVILIRKSGTLLNNASYNGKREIESTKSHPVNKNEPATDVLDSPGVKDAESYFNNHKPYPTSYLYDKAFHIDEGYKVEER